MAINLALAFNLGISYSNSELIDDVEDGGAKGVKVGRLAAGMTWPRAANWKGGSLSGARERKDDEKSCESH